MEGKALVLGCGSSGKAAAELLSNLGIAPVVLDGDDPFPAGDFRFAVVSPGIPLSHRWVKECNEKGISVIGELQLGCEELRRRGWKLLAVTGSKGKSSVVKVVADAISSAGLKAVACGNWGLAVSKVALEETPGWAVVEVSSFQLESTSLPSDTFEAAVLLNLQEDHLDRHGSLEHYHALKRRLLAMTHSGRMAPCREDAALIPEGSYFDNPVLRDNGAMAAFLMRSAGVGESAIKAAFAGFAALPHRMEEVATRNGVRYIDDSKATSLAAMAAALRMCAGNVRLIAGGLPKGDNPLSVSSDLTKRVKKVYLIGCSAEEFCNAWSKFVDCEICETLERAVASSMREAQSGETVLLSPGCASYDQFENFGQRGEFFARLVKKEGQNK